MRDIQIAQIIKDHPIVLQRDIEDRVTHRRHLSWIANAGEIDDCIELFFAEGREVGH